MAKKSPLKTSRENGVRKGNIRDGESKFTTKRSLAQRAAKEEAAKVEHVAESNKRVRVQKLREDRVNAGLPADATKAERTRRSNETLISFRLSPADVARFDAVLEVCAKNAKTRGRVPSRSRVARVAVEYLLNTFGAKADREAWLKDLVAA